MCELVRCEVERNAKATAMLLHTWRVERSRRRFTHSVFVYSIIGISMLVTQLYYV